MSAARWRLRSSTLVVAGALSLHELRYTLAPVRDAHALAARHSYLLVVIPVAAMLLGIVLASLLLRVAREPALEPESAAAHAGLPGARSRLAYLGTTSRRRVWAAASLALIALFVTQESLEALLSSGPAGLLTLFGAGSSAGPGLLASGGWLVLPLALAIGGGVTLGLGAVNGDLPPVLDPPGLEWRAPAPSAQLWTVNGADPRPLGALARHLAGRGPPLASTV